MMKTKQKKILLLEDDTILSQTLVQILKSENYDVTLVSDGEEAINTTDKGKFDMYLFDINVPIISGFD